MGRTLQAKIIEAAEQETPDLFMPVRLVAALDGAGFKVKHVELQNREDGARYVLSLQLPGKYSTRLSYNAVMYWIEGDTPHQVYLNVEPIFREHGIAFSLLGPDDKEEA